MPVISTFFGIVIRMFYHEHNPPHMHVEYQGKNALLDFSGNIFTRRPGIKDSSQASEGVD